MAKAAVKMPVLKRIEPLAGRVAGGAGIALQPAAPAYRLALRASEKSLPALSKALGVKLPQKPKTSTTSGSRTALWLGPDEWLVIDAGMHDPNADIAKSRVLHSAVDVSHRNCAILVNGPQAEAVLNAGCPLDLSLAAFPIGAATRTVLGKIEIVLLRSDEDAFRVECWRSFADYAFTYLADAASGL